jgi:hypothetical protein
LIAGSRSLSYLGLGLTVSVGLGCDSRSESHPNPTLTVKPKPTYDNLREHSGKLPYNFRFKSFTYFLPVLAKMDGKRLFHVNDTAQYQKNEVSVGENAK